MRIFAISDVHVDYPVNAQWVEQLSLAEYQDDVLILAGDVSDCLRRLQWCLHSLARRFKLVTFVPGNHDLWVLRDGKDVDSLAKFALVNEVARQCGVALAPVTVGGVTLLPLLAWYDYSFGLPDAELRELWMDYRACRWPAGMDADDIAPYFLQRNIAAPLAPGACITFSHYVPRLDLIGSTGIQARLAPLLGCARLEGEIRRHMPFAHVYGHSHMRQQVTLDGIRYINNALAYPAERQDSVRAPLLVYQQ